MDHLEALISDFFMMIGLTRWKCNMYSSLIQFANASFNKTIDFHEDVPVFIPFDGMISSNLLKLVLASYIVIYR